ncbi:uncharacterized protein [Dysidea avara]|uniref:uncharacterized protein n=1 Tax=Dysidea avara TaxID=196820 RepID=UPI003332F43F
MDKLQVTKELFRIGAIKFGSFQLKSGITSPIYCDLRVLFSYPQLLASVSELMWQCVGDITGEFSHVCGVPYTALPIATCVSVKHDIPMLLRRKEAKSYGTKRMVEGVYDSGSRCVVLEDVVTSGSSVLETVSSLQDVGVAVKHVVAIVDREQGAELTLTNAGLMLHSVLKLSEMVDMLEAEQLITTDTTQMVKQFLSTSQVPSKPQSVQFESYLTRCDLATHPIAKKLFHLMHHKQTNLALSADLVDSRAILELADQVGPHICVLKLHSDIIKDFSIVFTQQLKQLAEKHNFLLMEDRKFADIGNTCKLQLEGGTHRIAEWADMVTAHALPGRSILDVMTNTGVVLVGEMSSEGNLTTLEYAQATAEMAEQHPNKVVGVVSQRKLLKNTGQLHFTPGVRLSGVSSDGKGQQYRTPDHVIGSCGSDIIIVGRGIYEATDPVKAAIQYHTEGYKVYLHRINAS